MVFTASFGWTLVHHLRDERGVTALAVYDGGQDLQDIPPVLGIQSNGKVQTANSLSLTVPSSASLTQPLHNIRIGAVLRP